VLPAVRGTRAVFSERTNGGSFLDVEWDREQLARYGVTLADAQMAVQSAIGGENVTFTVEGPERHPVNVRYMRDFRSDPDSLGNVLISAEGGRKQIALGALAKVHVVNGPAMLRNEDGLLTGYVYVDLAGRDPGSYISEAAGLIRGKVALPPGYAVSWSGQYEGMERLRARLRLVVPLTVFLIFLLLYLNTRSLGKTLIVLLAVPFSAIGAIWFVYLLGYNLSVAVWVGLIALMGVDAETGVFMLLYLDLAYQRAKKESSSRTASALRQAIVEGSAKRLRPKFMTVATMAVGLVPIMWANGTGSEMMKRIAAPMIGGIFTSFVLELLIYPAVYEVWKSRFGHRWNAPERQVCETFCPEDSDVQTGAEQFA
jgi:copper/silver efflux system protein